MRVGKGWDSKVVRQELPDWHRDKLAALDVRIVSSYENTHHRAYVSEKIFDAFAVGGIPTYFACPKHRIFDLVGSTSMINTFDQTPEAAARRIMDFEPDGTFAEAWHAIAASLRDRFRDTATIVAERRRITEEALRELEALL